MNHEAFQGYPEPSSNTLYCPNQFFDVVLPHSSRGVVRLVGYMLRRILGWSDADGEPQEPTVAVSWNELERNAGIARGAIREAIDDAIRARFIRCLRPGRPHAPGQVAVPALYELCWDDEGGYVTAPEAFRGFFSGEGNRTYIPNAFFDHTLRTEPLAVIRVVGTIIRHTIGWQNRYGFRRQRVALSYTELQRFTHLSRQALNDALRQAIDHNHVMRLEAGYFDPQAGATSRPATYGIRWKDHVPMEEAPAVPAAEETLPDLAVNDAEPSVQKVDRGISSKSRPERFKNQTGGTVQKVDRERFENLTGHQFKKQTGLEITPINNSSLKQQQQSLAVDSPDSAVAVGASPGEDENGETVTLLIQQGFDEPAATSLASCYPAERIQRQCEWIKHRSAQRNRLGLLRRAIEQDWPEPQGETGAPGSGDGVGDPSSRAGVFAAHVYAGWAGNSGKPASVPSAADIRTSEAFLARLLEVSADETRIPEWGREFGEFVRRTCQTSDRARVQTPRSVVVALRSHGDEFFLDFAKRRQSDRKTELREARATHKARFGGAYTDYVRGREAELRTSEPERYAAFEAAEAARRRSVMSLARAEPLRQKLLATFEGEAEHLERLREHFQPTGHILDFWAWDRELNPERFHL
jgi:hypothetical protein